jgi:hypothetical protein
MRFWNIIPYTAAFVIAVLVVSYTLLQDIQSITVPPWNTSTRELIIFQDPMTNQDHGFKLNGWKSYRKIFGGLKTKDR